MARAKASRKRKAVRRQPPPSWSKVLERVQLDKRQKDIPDTNWKMLCGVEGAIRKIMRGA